MPRKALPSSQKKQIMSVSLPLPLIDQLTETTSNRSKFVLEALEAKLDHRDRPSVSQLIRLLTAELEQVKTIQQSYNIKPSNLEDLHQALSDLYYVMNPEVI